MRDLVSELSAQVDPAAMSAEQEALRTLSAVDGSLEAGRLYVLDRGYVAYELLKEIMQTHASFIVRVKHNTAFTAQEERPISDDARAGA